MEPLSPDEIMAAFPPHERRKVVRPLEPNWADLDFLGWIHRSGHLGFVVIEGESGPVGLALERNVIQTHGPRRFMCDLCCTLHGQGGVASFTRWNRGRTIARTAMLCANLECNVYVRGIRKNDCVQMAETLSNVEKIDRLKGNIQRIIVALG